MSAREENRQAVINLYPEDIHFFLGLPEGIRVQEIHTTWNPKSIAIVVAGDSLPSQPPDVQLPNWPGSVLRESMRTNADGKTWSRFNWNPSDVPQQF